MFVNGSHGTRYETEKLKIILRCLAGRKYIYVFIGAQTPVAMFSRTVNSGIGFLVENDFEVMLFGQFPHNHHDHLVVVNGQVRFFVIRGKFKLIGSHLVMSCLNGYAQFIGFGLEILHKRHDAGGNISKIMIFKLLVFCSRVPL